MTQKTNENSQSPQGAGYPLTAQGVFKVCDTPHLEISNPTIASNGVSQTNDSKTNSEPVKNGDKVQVHYTGKFNDGTVFDSSEGRTPLTFEVGSGQVIPGFDKALVGMKKEESKQIIIPSAEAYGPERKEMVVTFERKQLPAKPEPEVGMMLLLRDPQGHQLPARIVKVEKEMVTLDLNHPLAGKDLTFELKVVGINEASDPSGDSDCACGEEKEESGCCGGCGDDCECK